MTGVFFRPKFWKCEFLLPQNFRKFRNRQIPDEETKLWHLFDEDVRKWNCLVQIFSKFWRPKPSNLHWAALGSCFRHIRGIEEHTCYIDNIFHHSDFQGILFAVASRISIFICGLKFHIRNLWSMSCQIIRLFLFALDVMHTFQVDLDCRNDLHCWAVRWVHDTVDVLPFLAVTCQSYNSCFSQRNSIFHITSSIILNSKCTCLDGNNITLYM